MRNGTLVADAITLEDFLNELGGVAPSRIRWRPRPGKATEKDVISIYDREKRRFELIDGVLVEKVMGAPESTLAFWLGYLLQCFDDQRELGFFSAPDGPTRLRLGLVRYPDISFVSWDRLPTKTIPDDAIALLAPDLAIEILSKGNRKGEMDRKLREYFLAGVRLVWYINPRKRQVCVYTAPDQSRLFTEAMTLDGGDVLPGLALPVRRIFERLSTKPTQEKGKTSKRSKNNNGR